MSEYMAGRKVTCPTCNTKVRLEALGNVGHTLPVAYGRSEWKIHVSACPECEEMLIAISGALADATATTGHRLVWPTSIGRATVPKEVPEHIAQDYREAAAVLSISPKASAALSRRCLQAVLREAGAVKAGNLHNEIEQAIEKVPSYLADLLQLVRVIGNFAAHPMKSDATGQIVDVEPEEAELNLDVLDELFDHFYVKPARNRRIKEDLNEKLRQTNKPELS